MLASLPAPGNSLDIDQVPWSVRFFGQPASGGFVFLPAIDAATMEPIRFAFAANPWWEPAPPNGNGYSPSALADSFRQYGEVAGSGALASMVYVDPSPFSSWPAVTYAQSWLYNFENAEAPEWDPGNPPPLVEITFEEGDIPGADAGAEWDEVPPEAIEAAQAFPETRPAPWFARSSAPSSDPVLILESPLDLSTPEPSTFILAGGGIAFAGWLRSRRRRTT